MTAPDRPWCAWCGREIPNEAVRLRRLPRPGAHDDGEWFCDWTCEGHYSAAAPDAVPGRRPTRGTSVTRVRRLREGWL